MRTNQLKVLALAVAFSSPVRAMRKTPRPARRHLEAAATTTLYTCDELTPDLCDLQLTNGTLVVRGLSLTYWVYQRAPPGRSAWQAQMLPIIMVHGGPGWSHDYMLPLKQQACRGRKVIFYDQVGAGVSERPASANASAPWLLTIEYYVAELQAVADALVGGGPFHVLGSSWGTVVAQEYALQTPPPQQLASLVLSGPLSDGQLYIESQWDAVEGGLGTLPLFTQQRMRALEATPGGFDTEEYALINEELEAAFTVRTYPAPDCFRRAASLMNEEIYVAMQGASEFTIGGVLARWAVTPSLRRVATPTLLTHGRFDTMRPPVLRAMAAALPHAKVVLMPRSGHCSMIDDPQLMNDEVAAFLTCVESGATAAACTAGGEMPSRGEGPASLAPEQLPDQAQGVAPPAGGAASPLLVLALAAAAAVMGVAAALGRKGRRGAGWRLL